jgi:hypothetical protein
MRTSREIQQECRAVASRFKGTIYDVADDFCVDMERELAAVGARD